MFQTSECCIKLHAVVVLELLLSEQCPLLQVCVCVCVSTAPCVCTWMGQIQRTYFTAGYTLYNCVCKKKKKKKRQKKNFFFLQNRYPIMVKCLNIGKNISKPIYRLISTYNACFFSADFSGSAPYIEIICEHVICVEDIRHKHSKQRKTDTKKQTTVGVMLLAH